MESSSSTIASLLLRNLLTSIFLHAYKSLSYFQNYKILHLLRYCIVSSLKFHDYPFKPTASDENRSVPAAAGGAAAGAGGSGVSRALTQLLLLMNDIPVSSRKYEGVRSLAEKLIDENLAERNQALREVNCTVLSAAFSMSLSQLEAAMGERRWRSGGGDGGGDVAAGACESDDARVFKRVRSLLKGVKYYGRAAWRYAKPRSEASRSGSSAEKLAAELLWLAQKMAASGCAEEAVCKWASATKLAWLALSTEPRLQGSLVKVSGKSIIRLFVYLFYVHIT